MKKYLLLVVLSLPVLLLTGQTDVIFPREGSVINKCTIDSIVNGDQVYYTIGNKQHLVTAAGISRNGAYSDLTTGNTPMVVVPVTMDQGTYKGKDYSYYQQTYQRARSVRNWGMGMTFLGLAISTTGAFVMRNDGRNTDNTGAVVWIAGGLIGDAGIALWIYGGVKSSNNRKAMEQCKKNIDLSFGPTRDGMGMRIRF